VTGSDLTKTGALWRGLALVVLCGLVYYFSYDHGRESMLPKLDALSRQATEELSARRQEIQRLRSLLARCEAGDGPAAESPGRIPLKVNQSKTLFGGRLVISLLSVESGATAARIQLNFIQEGHLTAQDLAVGASLHFSLGDRDWAVVLGALTLTTASLNLIEIKPEP
jgi:hypothetical protein